MKTLTTILLAAAFFCMITSCSNSESGRSTPTDSTVSSGTAPVQYSEGTPDVTIDTTVQRRDAIRTDTLGGQRTLPQNQPNGNGANSSNTSDKRTTSGSANRGDADGDRKK